MSAPLEIEYKLLIQKPSLSWLEEQKQEPFSIEQVYLLLEKEGEVLRIRREEHAGSICYTKTSKVRLTDMSCIETEKSITEDTYKTLLQTQLRPGSAPIVKTRYRIPYKGHLLEIDFYPFLKTEAVLEIELKSENESYELPPEIRLIKDVTSDYRFKNTELANWLFVHPNEVFPC